MSRLRVAVVGSGISGLAVAHTLHGHADITVFEAEDYFGGHTHTVDITMPTPSGEQTFGVDTGFLVYNERTYPNLINLFAELKVPTVKSDMSFSVQVPNIGLEWSGSDLNSVFAQRGNLVKPAFWRMLKDLMRFNKQATQIAAAQNDDALMQPLSDFLVANAYSREFIDWYFLPMIGSIWSCPTDQMLQFPTATMIRFCHNHGLIQLSNRPQWFTVAGGARQYVEKILSRVTDKRLNSPVLRIERDASMQRNGVRVITAGKSELFDRVVIATHTDQALRMLATPSAAEQQVLGAIRYQDNLAVLHTDKSALPKRELAWAAWNYERASSTDQEQARVCLHYLINKLQPIPTAQAVIVSLNPVRDIAQQHLKASFNYTHPVFDQAAVRAQTQLIHVQGQANTYFCGAWAGYGFHEDGLKSGLSVAASLLRETNDLVAA
jgi:uncharacterized protein